MRGDDRVAVRVDRYGAFPVAGVPVLASSLDAAVLVQNPLLAPFENADRAQSQIPRNAIDAHFRRMDLVDVLKQDAAVVFCDDVETPSAWK